MNIHRICFGKDQLVKLKMNLNRFIYWSIPNYNSQQCLEWLKTCKIQWINFLTVEVFMIWPHSWRWLLISISSLLCLVGLMFRRLIMRISIGKKWFLGLLSCILKFINLINLSWTYQVILIKLIKLFKLSIKISPKV